MTIEITLFPRTTGLRCLLMLFLTTKPLSIAKYYYMDIPQDTCEELLEFEKKYNAKLLGADWRKTIFDSYSDFCAENDCENKSAKCLKAEFSEQILTAFYETMDYIFREGFGTGSKTDEQMSDGLSNLLFGEK